jgi:MSHA pilin protein MshA
MNKQKGFTLIELVVVIIILGILAVTAAPKFINLQSDARASALQGVKGAIQGANSLVFAKAALAGEEKKGGAANTDRGSVGIGAANPAITQFGYLQTTVAELNNAIDANFGTAGTDWIVDATTTPGVAVISQNGAPATTTTPAAACTLTYTDAADASTVPTYVIVDNGC